MSKMIEVKTAELTGPALDWAVGSVEGWRISIAQNGMIECLDKYGEHFAWVIPSESWSICGPLIEKHGICLSAPCKGDPTWDAYIYGENDFSAEDCSSALIAACRAIVAAKLGDVVSVPAELLEGRA